MRKEFPELVDFMRWALSLPRPVAPSREVRLGPIEGRKSKVYHLRFATTEPIEFLQLLGAFALQELPGALPEVSVRELMPLFIELGVSACQVAHAVLWSQRPMPLERYLSDLRALVGFGAKFCHRAFLEAAAGLLLPEGPAPPYLKEQFVELFELLKSHGAEFGSEGADFAGVLPTLFSMRCGARLGAFMASFPHANLDARSPLFPDWVGIRPYEAMFGPRLGPWEYGVYMPPIYLEEVSGAYKVLAASGRLDGLEFPRLPSRADPPETVPDGAPLFADGRQAGAYTGGILGFGAEDGVGWPDAKPDYLGAKIRRARCPLCSSVHDNLVIGGAPGLNVLGTRFATEEVEKGHISLRDAYGRRGALKVLHWLAAAVLRASWGAEPIAFVGPFATHRLHVGKCKGVKGNIEVDRSVPKGTTWLDIVRWLVISEYPPLLYMVQPGCPLRLMLRLGLGPETLTGFIRQNWPPERPGRPEGADLLETAGRSTADHVPHCGCFWCGLTPELEFDRPPPPRLQYVGELGHSEVVWPYGRKERRDLVIQLDEGPGCFSGLVRGFGPRIALEIVACVAAGVGPRRPWSREPVVPKGGLWPTYRVSFDTERAGGVLEARPGAPMTTWWDIARRLVANAYYRVCHMVEPSYYSELAKKLLLKDSDLVRPLLDAAASDAAALEEGAPPGTLCSPSFLIQCLLRLAGHLRDGVQAAVSPEEGLRLVLEDRAASVSHARSCTCGFFSDHHSRLLSVLGVDAGLLEAPAGAGVPQGREASSPAADGWGPGGV